jgi:cytochrome c-type biogenesis protein CcmE
MKRRHRGLGFAAVGLAAIAVATALVLSAFRNNLVFFFTPSQIANKEAPAGRIFRLGGLVQNGSLVRGGDGLTFRFEVTDTVKTTPVIYHGLLPDLFKEGRGCVAEGKLHSDGVFYADQVLAKHDENYMPPEAAKALELAKPVGAK